MQSVDGFFVVNLDNHVNQRPSGRRNEAHYYLCEATVMPCKHSFYQWDDVYALAISTGKFCVWASYQIRKIVGCSCAGNAGNVFPAMYHDTCVTNLRFPLKSVAGKTFPAFLHNPHFCVSGRLYHWLWNRVNVFNNLDGIVLNFTLWRLTQQLCPTQSISDKYHHKLRWADPNHLMVSYLVTQ